MKQAYLLFEKKILDQVFLLIITHVRPSLISSPDIVNLFFFNKLCSVAYLLITLVNALLKPSKWVPPSFW